MARKQVAFTWQILADDAEQDALFRVAPFGRAEDQPLQVRAACPGHRLWWGMLGLALIVAVVAGYRLYRTAQAGVAVLESELQEAIVLDSYTAANPANEAEHAPPALQSFDLRDGVAAVEVVVDDPSRPTPYRETRFFRETERGWEPATPDASFWGPWQQLESEHFIICFHHRDYAAVVEAAPALDALYTRLHQDLGRAMPDADEKVIIEVLPNYEFEQHGLPSATEDRIQVPSPALLEIPLDVSDTEVLALSVSVRLVYRLFPRISADWSTNENRPTGWWWSPLTEGLRLWLLWENDPLFASWRRDILTWYLTDSCQPCLGQSPSLPAEFREFCQTISMSGLYPLSLFIAIPCEGYFLDTENYICFPPAPPAHLSTLATQTPGTSTSGLEAGLFQMTFGGQVVSMATLLEYVAATYERERIPAFLDAFGTYQRWDALVEAVFGISAEEFEAGWHAYLQEQYGMTKP